jgi:hypothetical protein
MSGKMILYKLVVLGDGGVGKVHYTPLFRRRTELAATPTWQIMKLTSIADRLH